jgi:hypothetical protein
MPGVELLLVVSSEDVPAAWAFEAGGDTDKTGSEVWRRELEHYAWSSPTDFRDESGHTWLLQGQRGGHVDAGRCTDGGDRSLDSTQRSDRGVARDL